MEGLRAVTGTGRRDEPVKRVRARAHPNVALVKYWGKRDRQLNLPSVGSISLTLGGLSTEVTIQAAEGPNDEYWSNGHRVEGQALRNVSQFVRLCCALAGSEGAISVHTRSNFPVAAGLASSASTFAALTLALTHFLGLNLSRQQLSALARRGSGSACRSLWGGFVEWRAGELPDGSDSFALPLPWPHDWPLAVVIAVIDPNPKPIGSRDGMHRSTTSPFYPVWVSTQDADLDTARAAIRSGDLERLGTLAEHNCLKMHAVALTAQPPLIYWAPGTLAAIATVRELRATGVPAYFTIDAGPQVKVLCDKTDESRVAAALRDTPGVTEVLLTRPGEDARLVEEPLS
ncbi:MAG: diphosphomevalonate decarboxylase [Candidatus Binatia bacterium]|nr:diphosphomevalonate decarboxylase [Candidatus Binatia bacterium]